MEAQLQGQRVSERLVDVDLGEHLALRVAQACEDELRVRSDVEEDVLLAVHLVAQEDPLAGRGLLSEAYRRALASDSQRAHGEEDQLSLGEVGVERLHLHDALQLAPVGALPRGQRAGQVPHEVELAAEARLPDEAGLVREQEAFAAARVLDLEVRESQALFEHALAGAELVRVFQRVELADLRDPEVALVLVCVSRSYCGPSSSCGSRTPSPSGSAR